MIFAKHLAQWSIPTLLETSSKAGLMAFAAYLLPKSDFGILTLAMLMFSLHPILQLGIVDGLIIKLPGYFIKKDELKMSLILGLSLTYSVAVVSVVIVAFFVYGLSDNLNSKTLLICGAFLLTAIPYQIYNHYLLFNRYSYNLIVTLYARVFNAAQRVILQLPLLYFLGLYGFVVGEVIIYIISAWLIVFLSRSHVKPNLNKNRFKKLLKFGFPLWIISLLTMLSASLERSVSAYYFTLEVVADIGLVSFLGALVLQVFGQVLSLFSQYSREFYVKTSDERSLVNAFFVYTHGALLAYIIIISLFYAVVADLIIPTFLKDYLNVGNLLAITYGIFLLRIVLAILVSLLTIVGERKRLIIGQLVFFLGSAFSLFFFSLNSGLSPEELLTSILIGILLQLVYFVTVSAFITKDLSSTSIIWCSAIPSIVPIWSIWFYDGGWLLATFIGLAFFIMLALPSLLIGRGVNKVTDFVGIIKKHY